MRTVQMTLDEELVDAVDRAARKLGTSRSAFTRRALQDALRRLHQLQLEEKHRRGYARQPVRSGEFDVWEAEQAWPEPSCADGRCHRHPPKITASGIS